MDRIAHISFSGNPVPKRLLSRRALKQVPSIHERANDSDPISPFISWVFEKAGLDAFVYRPASLSRRLSACFRRLRVSSAEAGRALIESRPELLNAALDTLLLGVSEFFRDVGVFAHLSESILPEMLRTNRELRICSVGVSEGHELYSMAILLAEAGALGRCQLLGVDCRPEAINRARAGWFSEHDMSGVSEHLRNRYFNRDSDGWRAKEKLRERIHWKVENVLNLDASFQNDIILFRNLVLYLTAHHADCAWGRLYGQLKPDGVLVCGKADKPPANLPLMRIASCIYQKPVSSGYVY